MKNYKKAYEQRRFYRTYALVIMNENHSLLPEQEKILQKNYESYDVLSVPAEGWMLEQMKEKVQEIYSMDLGGKRYLDVIFVSPIPYMIRELTRREVYFPASGYAESTHIAVRVFHNDEREKKELPNGKIIQVVAQDGWELV